MTFAPEDIVLALLIGMAALLYSSVGHAGASGYLAAMALLGVAPAVMKPAALALNVLVASIATVKFQRAGAFSWRIFWPLAITSIPCAWLGGSLDLPGHVFKPVVGAVLLFAAWQLFRTAAAPVVVAVRAPARWQLMPIGAGLGLLSGLTGVGGGIFLSPILLLLGWAETRVVSGIAALFILVNSIAGLAGTLQTGATLPPALPLWAVAAAIGGWIGASYGSRKLAGPVIRRLLALVLVIAGGKMLLAI